MNKLQGIILDSRNGLSIPQGLEEYIKGRYPEAKVSPLKAWSQLYGQDNDSEPIGLLVEHDDMVVSEYGFCCYVFGVTPRTTLYRLGETEESLTIHFWYCLPNDDPFSYIQKNF